MSRGQGVMNIRSSRSKTKRWTHKLLTILLVIGAAATGYFAINYALPAWQTGEEIRHIESLGVSTKAVTQKELAEHKVDPDKPRYLSIPSAGVAKARTIALGVKPPAGENGSQQLEAPTNIGDVGWYNCQSNPIEDKRCDTPKRPGDGNTETAALFDAHTCFSKKLTCVFDQISKLHKDDSIIIERGDGRKLNYRVAKVDILDLADVDMRQAMAPVEADREGITLITCAGTYKGAVDASGVPTASKRVLVYAVLE